MPRWAPAAGWCSPPDLERALAQSTLDALAPLAEAGKLGALLLPLSPSFSPRRHELAELDGLLDELSPHPSRSSCATGAGWRATAPRARSRAASAAVAWVGVDAPRDEHFTIMPAVDAVTDERLAYLRAHGRNAEGYVSGARLPSASGRLLRRGAGEIVGRARELARETARYA